MANFTQFPEDYVKSVALCIEGCNTPTIVNKLKEVSTKNAHSIFGIIERLKLIDKCPDVEIGGAATNLKKKSALNQLLNLRPWLRCCW